MNQAVPRPARGPSSDDFSHDGSVAGPLRDLRKALDGHGSPDAPFTEDETAIVCAWLSPRQIWDADALADAREEIEGFARDPALARAFLEERLSGPFATWMREHADNFANALPSWFRRVNAPVPDANRVAVLQAFLVVVYDLAGIPAGHVAPPPDSLPAAWRGTLA
mgnify:CR=1 FL=1